MSQILPLWMVFDCQAFRSAETEQLREDSVASGNWSFLRAAAHRAVSLRPLKPLKSLVHCHSQSRLAICALGFMSQKEIRRVSVPTVLAPLSAVTQAGSTPDTPFCPTSSPVSKFVHCSSSYLLQDFSKPVLTYLKVFQIRCIHEISLLLMLRTIENYIKPNYQYITIHPESVDMLLVSVTQPVCGAQKSDLLVLMFTGEGQYGKVYTCISVDTGELMAMKEVSQLGPLCSLG